MVTCSVWCRRTKNHFTQHPCKPEWKYGACGLHGNPNESIHANPCAHQERSLRMRAINAARRQARRLQDLLTFNDALIGNRLCVHNLRLWSIEIWQCNGWEFVGRRILYGLDDKWGMVCFKWSTCSLGSLLWPPGPRSLPVVRRASHLLFWQRCELRVVQWSVVTLCAVQWPVVALRPMVSGRRWVISGLDFRETVVRLQLRSRLKALVKL